MQPRRPGQLMREVLKSCGQVLQVQVQWQGSPHRQGKLVVSSFRSFARLDHITSPHLFTRTLLRSSLPALSTQHHASCFVHLFELVGWYQD